MRHTCGCARGLWCAAVNKGWVRNGAAHVIKRRYRVVETTRRSCRHEGGKVHLRSKSNELDVEKVQPVAFTCGRKIGLPAGMARHCGAKIIPHGSHRVSLVCSSRFSHPHPPYSPSHQAATLPHTPAKLREGPRQPLRTSRASHRTHTSAGESGAGFGRSGQVVSGKCEGGVAGSRSPHRYRLIVRSVR